MKKFIKWLLQDPNEKEYYLLKDDKLVSYHDACHLKCQSLQPIEICGHKVTGTGGISIALFDTQNQIEQYSSKLDECRVAFHQLIKKTNNPCCLVRAAYWSCWLIKQGENPARVLKAHKATLK
jgi:hypothetical protein